MTPAASQTNDENAAAHRERSFRSASLFSRKAPALCMRALRFLCVLGVSAVNRLPPRGRSVFQSGFSTLYVLYPRRFLTQHQDRAAALSPVRRGPADSGLSLPSASQGCGGKPAISESLRDLAGRRSL